jgi:hypothetical protein
VADRIEFHFDVAEAWPRFAEVGLKPLKMAVKEEHKGKCGGTNKENKKYSHEKQSQ